MPLWFCIGLSFCTRYGSDSVEAMAHAAQELGYEYVGIEHV
jgi:hypothetical protein